MSCVFKLCVFCQNKAIDLLVLINYGLQDLYIYIHVP